MLASTLIGAHGFEHLISNSIPLLTTVMAVELGLGALQVGAIVAVRSASAGITSVTGGFLSDLLHHRIAWVLSISAFLTAVGLLLIAVSPSYGVILLALALASSGAALWHPPALGLLAQRFPNRRGLFLSMHRSTGSVGDVVGPMIAGILLLGALRWEAADGLTIGWELGLEPVSWRWILACGAPIMFIATFVIYGLLRHAGNAPPVGVDLAERLRTMWRGTYVAFRGTGLWAIFAVAAVRGMADGSMLFLVPLYLTHGLGINTFQASAHLALMVGPAIVTASAYRRVVRPGGPQVAHRIPDGLRLSFDPGHSNERARVFGVDNDLRGAVRVAALYGNQPHVGRRGRRCRALPAGVQLPGPDVGQQRAVRGGGSHRDIRSHRVAGLAIWVFHRGGHLLRGAAGIVGDTG